MNPLLAHLFMICSNIKLTGPAESIGIHSRAIREWNQWDSGMGRERSITLGSETDFDGWRKAARTLARHEVEPSAVTWSVRSNAPEPVEPSAAPFETPNNA